MLPFLRLISHHNYSAVPIDVRRLRPRDKALYETVLATREVLLLYEVCAMPPTRTGITVSIIALKRPRVFVRQDVFQTVVLSRDGM